MRDIIYIHECLYIIFSGLYFHSALNQRLINIKKSNKERSKRKKTNSPSLKNKDKKQS